MSDMLELVERSVFRIASDVDCGSPDARSSEGAEFLREVWQATLTEIENEGADVNLDAIRDRAEYVVDGAMPVYTHDIWRTYVDLAAYNEDLDGFESSSMTVSAQVALMMIGERVVNLAVDEYADAS